MNVNGTFFFFTGDSTKGTEFWKSDGTETGTVLVKNIDAAWSSYPLDLTNVNGTLFFSATDGEHGQEFWKSYGTEAGTVMVKDITRMGTHFLPIFSGGGILQMLMVLSTSLPAME